MLAVLLLIPQPADDSLQSPRVNSNICISVMLQPFKTQFEASKKTEQPLRPPFLVFNGVSAYEDTAFLTFKKRDC